MADLPAEAVQAAVEALQALGDAPDAYSTLAAFRWAVATVAVEAAAPILAAQVQRETAQQIAREIRRQKPAGNTPMTWESGLRRGARVARQIGEADDSH